MALMADETVGFNPTLQAITTGIQLPTFTLDFSATSKNVLQGWYAAKDLIATTTTKFPLMCVYTIKSQNQNTAKFATFSGSVMFGLDTYLSFPPSQARNNTDDLVDAVEGTLYTVFNSPSNYGYYGDVQYNGDLTIQRGPIAKGAQNWLQLISSRLTFDLIAA